VGGECTPYLPLQTTESHKLLIRQGSYLMTIARWWCSWCAVRRFATTRIRRRSKKRLLRSQIGVRN